MNFYLLRILIFVFIIAVLFIIRKIFVKKITLSKRIVMIILILCYMIVYIIPYEKYFIKLSTVDKAFNYYFPNCFMRYKYESDDYAYVLFSDGSSDLFMYFVNSNDRWEFDNIYNRGQGDLVLFDNYDIFVNEIPKKKVTAVVVFPKKYNSDINVITDSLDTKFNKIIGENGNWISKGYIAIIEGELEKEYTLILNGDNYKIRS